MIYDLRFTIYERFSEERRDAERAESRREDIFLCVSSAFSATLRLSADIRNERRLA